MKNKPDIHFFRNSYINYCKFGLFPHETLIREKSSDEEELTSADK
jgi:hypothetical protein